MWAIVAVAVGGLAILIGLMAVMKAELHFDTELIVAFTLLGFLLLVAAESVFIWMALRTKRGAKKTDKTQPKGLATKEIGAAAERALAEPALSVTEHTTRTLEPAHTERKTE